MTIRHLRVFITVCDCGKMSLAAKKLHIAQPSVSQAVLELEKHYGIKLFERLSKKLYITTAGIELLNYARHIVDSFDEMDEKLIAQSKNIKLKIGATITVGTCVLSDLLCGFNRHMEGIETQIIVENTGIIEEMILKNELDIGIVEGKIKSDLINIIPIMKDELILVSSNHHKFAHKNKLTIQCLNNEDFILREKGSGTRELFENALKQAGVSINEKWICSNSEAIKNAVINTEGLTVISKMLVERELELGLLHKIQIEEVSFNRYFHIAYHKNKYLSISLQKFIHICKTFKLNN